MSLPPNSFRVTDICKISRMFGVVILGLLSSFALHKIFVSYLDWSFEWIVIALDIFFALNIGLILHFIFIYCSGTERVIKWPSRSLLGKREHSWLQRWSFEHPSRAQQCKLVSVTGIVITIRLPFIHRLQSLPTILDRIVIPSMLSGLNPSTETLPTYRQAYLPLPNLPMSL